MQFIRKLPEAEEIIEKYPLSATQKSKLQEITVNIQDILSGKSNKKIICVGPCSADREDAVVEYVKKLADLQEQVKDKFLIIPRIYTCKPFQ